MKSKFLALSVLGALMSFTVHVQVIQQSYKDQVEAFVKEPVIK